VVVNAAGSAVDPASGRLWADYDRRLPAPGKDERRALATAEREGTPSLATTIGVVLTDLTLTKARARKVAAVAHDGMARAIRPVHSMSDGDTVFCLGSGRLPAESDPVASFRGFNDLLRVAAEVFAAACLDALLAADGRGRWAAYAELAPSVRRT
jgi:L-aminopeptidase/D-esterase-like protein